VTLTDYRSRFVDGLGFGLDPFQIEAIEAIDQHVNVLVSAPTGSGKTIIADYAIGRVLERGERAFYTTPLKALSNQKFHELSALFGDARVGLLTGDTSYNANADIIVMTTEVLRNMLLTESQHLTSLGLVVLDEVHYLQDPFRGGVWEEVIILTPSAVRFVALSATIGNADFLGSGSPKCAVPPASWSKRRGQSNYTTTSPSFGADSRARRSWIYSTAPASRTKRDG
jgi:ATP-dependent RNA helicase HelY